MPNRAARRRQAKCPHRRSQGKMTPTGIDVYCPDCGYRKFVPDAPGGFAVPDGEPNTEGIPR